MIDVDLSEWSWAAPENDKRLRGLRLPDAHSRDVAKGLERCRALEITPREDGLAVRSFAHVGRIEIGELRVTIRPKLAPLMLLELVRYAYSLRNFQLFGDATFTSGHGGFQDLIIAQLRAEAREIISRGVARRYVRRSDDLHSPRGRVDVERLARASNPSLVTLPCTHHPRSSDFLLNQVLLSGLQLGSRLACSRELKREVGRTVQLYADLATPVRLSDETLRAANRALNRQVSVYEPALRLVRALYDGSRLGLEDGTTLGLKGFLFDMNRFFQALLGRFLRESLPDCDVEDEVPLRGMMAYRDGFNPRKRRSPLPRPDFAVRHRRGPRHLLDAKYRDIWENDLPREMLYQLAVYAMSQPQGATAAILYPTEASAARESILEIREPASSAIRAYVALRPVIVEELLDLVRDGAHHGRQQEQLARRLVFGREAEEAGRGQSGSSHRVRTEASLLR